MKQTKLNPKPNKCNQSKQSCLFPVQKLFVPRSTFQNVKEAGEGKSKKANCFQELIL